MLAVKGNDVMETLKIEPGPEVGKILNILLEEVLDSPVLNDRDKLVVRVRELAKLPEKELDKMTELAKLKAVELQKSTKQERRELRHQEKMMEQKQRARKEFIKRIIFWFSILIVIGALIF